MITDIPVINVPVPPSERATYAYCGNYVGDSHKTWCRNG